jgi:hypothetical protein
LIDPSILKTGRPACHRLRAQCAPAKRVRWHFSDLPTPLTNVGYQGKSGRNSAIAKSTRLTRKRHCGVTACPLILPQSRSPVRRVSAPRSRGTAQFQLTYGMLVGLAASAFFAPMIAAATAWFENNRCLAVSLGAATAFCCQEVHQCRGSADGPHRKYLPVSDRCRLVRLQVRADVSGRSIEFVAPLLDPIRSDVEETPRRPRRKQPKASLPALEWLAAKRYKKVCLGHKKCRPEEWRLTVVPQFRLRCSAMEAITKRGSP